MQKVLNRIGIEHAIPFRMYTFFVLSLLVLAILQDYIYSLLKDTGFYLSESALYNTIWIFLVPISLLDIFLHNKIESKSVASKIVYTVLVSIALSLLHIAASTALFIFVSHVAFSTPHRFAHIFSSALSNQFYVLILIYSAVPYINQMLAHRKAVKQKKAEEVLGKITVRQGVQKVLLNTESIVHVVSDKPYSIVHTVANKYLCDDNLKKIEQKLGTDFMRVHRSIIINKHCVTHLESRRNGDYDVRLTNNKSIRMSRHFRQNWDELIH